MSSSLSRNAITGATAVALLAVASYFVFRDQPAPAPPASTKAENIESQNNEPARFGSNGRLPDVALINQDGKPVRLREDVVKGKIAVFSFIYTSCLNICPLVTSRLAEVQAKLAAQKAENIVFVSISIDPIPDTPEKLKAYASAFKVLDNWAFLTGDARVIDDIRFRLGERSGTQITNHKNDVLLYNDTTGEWAHDSAMSDIDNLALTIRNMDPSYRSTPHPLPSGFAQDAAGPVHEMSGNDVPGQALFIKACASCHNIGGGDKVGPDLANVLERRTREWFGTYISAPEKLRAANDPVAMELRGRFGAVKMPNLGLAESDVNDLATYIATRAAKVHSAGGAAAGNAESKTPSDRPVP